MPDSKGNQISSEGLRIYLQLKLNFKRIRLNSLSYPNFIFKYELLSKHMGEMGSGKVDWIYSGNQNVKNNQGQ